MCVGERETVFLFSPTVLSAIVEPFFSEILGLEGGTEPEQSPDSENFSPGG